MNITSKDVVQWLREQSAAYSAMADKIESGSAGAVLASLIQPQPPALTPERIKAELRLKAMRLADLEKEFQVSRKELELIIRDPANGMSIGDRGWITIVEQ